MPDFITTLIQSMPFQGMIIFTKMMFIIAVLEAVCCIATAMRFNVTVITDYTTQFSACYAISAQRDRVTWKESKQHWLLWLRVVTGGCHFTYTSPTKMVTVKNICSLFIDAAYFAILFVLVPFYLLFAVGSVFERVFRYFLGFIGFIVFWVLAKLKIILSYYRNGYTIAVRGDRADSDCTIKMLYGKPTIEILLLHPRHCSDETQKDNINRFTASLKNIFPQQNRITFKTKVYYPNGVHGLQQDLPLTEKFIRIAFKNVFIMPKEAAL